MISVCDDILLEDMESQDFMDTFIDQSFHEAIDTLFGYDGENNYTYDSKHKKLAELHDDAAFSCADERDCDDTCGSQGHMVPISGNGSDGSIAVFVSRNTDYR